MTTTGLSQKETPMDPRMIAGISRSYYWAAEHMQSQLASRLGPGHTKGIDPSSKDPFQIAIVGSNQSTIVLWALSTEVALKALHSLESGRDPSHDHNLANLFKMLKCGTRSSLERRFQAIRKQGQLSKDRTNSLTDVFNEHNKDFIDWRYIYEKPGLSNQILDLKPAVEAILEEFEDRDRRLN